MDNILKLSKPIQAHGKEVTELSFRALTPRDIVKCGMPVVFVEGHSGTAASLEPAALSKYISELAQIPPSSVDQLSVSDFFKAQAVVMGFFGTGGGDLDAPISLSPASLN